MRYQKIGDTKRATPIEVLCDGHPGNFDIECAPIKLPLIVKLSEILSNV